MSTERSFSFARIRPQDQFVARITPPQEFQGDSLWFLYQGDLLVVVQEEHELLPLLAHGEPDGLPLQRRQYLGCWGDGDGGLHCFAGELPADSILPSPLAAVDLRSLFGQWDERWVGVAGRAKQVIQWDRDHQYCGRCGAPTEAVIGERARHCRSCGLSSYPRISPAIIIAVTRVGENGEEILLARNLRFPPGRYSVVAGFVEAGETLEECAVREVHEEVGIDIANVHYFGSQPWPFPHSLMIGFTADYAGGAIDLEESEIADAQWFAPENMPQLPPKISIARRLIDSYLLRQAQPPSSVRDW